MAVVSRSSTSEDNITAVLRGLRRQGIENPEQYVAGTEYIFFLRQDRTKEWPGEVYDVIVRLPADRVLPRYVFRAIATAIREETLEDDVIQDVQFEMYLDAFGRFFGLSTDSPVPEALGLNNCFFKRERATLHDELWFRSKGEVAIYDELKQRDVLFFPNPAAVLGTSGAEYGQQVKKLEPDFLICCKGKLGILEINGDSFHSGLVKTTKDHDRARLFNCYGVYFVQAYDSERCKNDPVGVIDEFLMLLSNHK
jgi:hypothetical protein